MIKINCYYCDNELEEVGAILLSPPDDSGQVNKYHICKKCYSIHFQVVFDIRELNKNFDG